MRSGERSVWLVAAACVVLAACSGAPDPALNGHYRLTAIDGKPVVIPPKTSATLVLADGRMSGDNGCNGFETRYRAHFRTIAVTQKARQTLVICRGANARLASLFDHRVLDAVTYTLGDRTLTLTAGDGSSASFTAD